MLLGQSIAFVKMLQTFNPKRLSNLFTVDLIYGVIEIPGRASAEPCKQANEQPTVFS
jgi:hypothetical protein